MERFNFNPQNGFKDVSTFPNPQNGDETRNQLNVLHMQTRDFINDVLKPIIDGLQATDTKGIISSDGSVEMSKTDGVYDLKVSVKGGGATVAYVDAKDQEIKEYVDTEIGKVNVIDQIYPVGSIYMTTVNTNPSTLFPNTTWEMLKDRFLLGAGDSYAGGTIGGEATHTLTIDEMPSHEHGGVWYETSWKGTNTNWDASRVTESGGWKNTTSTGGGQAHNNMPPYLVVYMWRRVS